MATPRAIPLFYQRLFRVSLVLMPYLSYLGMVGLFVVLVHLLQRFRRLALDRVVGRGLGAIALLMLVSCLVAENKGEAFLQLTNFFPYFLFFGAMPYILAVPNLMAQVARDLVVSLIPLNAIALVEYLLKRPNLFLPLQQLPLIAWIRSAPHIGRAMVTFGHPNTFASYLVLVLGLGLGTLLVRRKAEGGGMKPEVPSSLHSPPSTPPSSLIFPPSSLPIGVLCCLVGIFCSGSRNGLLVAIAQLLLFGLFVKINPRLRWLIMGGVGAIALVAAVLGIGGRSLNPAGWMQDPRVKVWQFALGLVGQRPWLGWGLGNYKFEYPPDLIPGQEPINHPHNFWLLLAVEVGVPLMLGLTLLVGFVCYRAVRRAIAGHLKPEQHPLLLSYGLSFLGCVAFGLLDVTLYDARVNALGWIVLAGLYTLGDLDQMTQTAPRRGVE